MIILSNSKTQMNVLHPTQLPGQVLRPQYDFKTALLKDFVRKPKKVRFTNQNPVRCVWTITGQEATHRKATSLGSNSSHVSLISYNPYNAPIFFVQTTGFWLVNLTFRVFRVKSIHIYVFISNQGVGRCLNSQIWSMRSILVQEFRKLIV